MNLKQILLIKMIFILLFQFYIFEQHCSYTFAHFEQNQLVLSDNLLHISTDFLERLEIEKQPIYKAEDKFIPHYTVFDCYFTGDNENISTIIVDFDGKIVGGIEGYWRVSHMVDSTTLLLTNDSHMTFWNLQTGVMEHTIGFDYHHDYEYNPITETFLFLGQELNGTVDIAGEIYPIMHDFLVEVDKTGKILWEWRGCEHIPFDQKRFYLINHTKSGYADWTHGNSVCWDMESNMIYYNSRDLSTVFKIDKNNGNILWQIGAYNSDFKMYNKFGEESSSLFYGAHDLQLIGKNHFTIYDNDYFNLTNFISQHTRYVEFMIDESTWEAREIWTWEAPNSHYCRTRGGVDKLPSGNYIGSNGGYANGLMKNITEVNFDGEIVWELSINNSVFYRSEEFFTAPIVKVDYASLISTKKQNAMLNLTVWNSYKNRITENAHIKLYEEETLLLNCDFEFLPNWQETKFSLELPTENYKTATYDLTVIIENAEGFETTLNLDLTIKRATAVGFLLCFITIILTSKIATKRRKYSLVTST